MTGPAAQLRGLLRGSDPGPHAYFLDPNDDAYQFVMEFYSKVRRG